MFEITKTVQQGLALGLLIFLCALSSAQNDINSVRIRAERGDPIAQTELADFYRVGQDVPQDAGLALKWYRLAGEQDYTAAQVSLGTMYHLGLGTGKDDSVAASWYLRAVRNGDPGAMFMLGQLYRNGSGVKKDSEKAMTLFAYAAEKGNVWALESLGLMYYEGEGVPKDYKKALQFLIPTAEKGSPNAQYHVGLIYKAAPGVNKDHLAQAANWIKQAAQWGLIPAQLEYAAMLRRGEGTEPSYVDAYKWYVVVAARADQQKQKEALAGQAALRVHLTARQIQTAKNEANKWLKDHVPTIPEHYH